MDIFQGIVMLLTTPEIDDLTTPKMIFITQTKSQPWREIFYHIRDHCFIIIYLMELIMHFSMTNFKTLEQTRHFK